MRWILIICLLFGYCSQQYEIDKLRNDVNSLEAKNRKLYNKIFDLEMSQLRESERVSDIEFKQIVESFKR